ncbi:hypothetical protein [Candidatus Amarolinea dominans]
MEYALKAEGHEIITAGTGTDRHQKAETENPIFSFSMSCCPI